MAKVRSLSAFATCMHQNSREKMEKFQKKRENSRNWWFTVPVRSVDLRAAKDAMAKTPWGCSLQADEWHVLKTWPESVGLPWW